MVFDCSRTRVYPGVNARGSPIRRISPPVLNFISKHVVYIAKFPIGRRRFRKLRRSEHIIGFLCAKVLLACHRDFFRTTSPVPYRRHIVGFSNWSVVRMLKSKDSHGTFYAKNANKTIVHDVPTQGRVCIHY